MAARRTGWMGRVAGAILGALLAAGAAPAAAGNSAAEKPTTRNRTAEGAADQKSAGDESRDVFDDAREIVGDLQALREPMLFEYDGLDVAEAEDGYTVTLGDVRFVPTDGGYADAGTVALRLVTEVDGYSISAFDMPARMPLRRVRGGAEIGVLHLPLYHLTGSWSGTEQALLSLKLDVDKLRLEEPVGRERVSIDSARSSFLDTPDADGTWSEAGQFELRGLKSVEGARSVEVAEIAVRWNIEKMDRQGTEDMLSLFSAAAERVDAPFGKVPTEDLRRLRQLDSVFGGIRIEAEMHDFTIVPAGGTPRLISHGRIEMAGADLDQELSRVTLRLQLDGMDLAIDGKPADDLENVLAPDSLEVSLAVEDLPGRSVWDALIDGMAPTEVPEEEAAMRLGLALQAAGTKLRIMSSRFTSSITDIYADGMLQAHAPAAFGVVLAISLDATGLDRLSGLVAGQKKSADAIPFLDLIAWFDKYGRPGTTPGGAPSNHVDIAIDPDGQLTVNGRPVPLFGEPPSEMEN